MSILYSGWMNNQDILSHSQTHKHIQYSEDKLKDKENIQIHNNMMLHYTSVS